MSLSKWEKHLVGRAVLCTPPSGFGNGAHGVRALPHFNDRWGSAYSAPDLSVLDRWFLPLSCLMLFWIFDGLF